MRLSVRCIRSLFTFRFSGVFQQTEKACEGRTDDRSSQTDETLYRAVSVHGNNAPVRCIRYITDRAGQSGYREAEENGLPVGSGEIESAHRYIIRKRLKIAGAWRKENNAQNMISLRVNRADGDWESYRKKADRM
ncbi:MAG: hypothetical protein BWK80_60030 [Desulfobacteraceae bacterium IS3]|nr:MAG: hypothetical protein BWK80_60030 [Desulfobacteraceae bacterium IS3]